jgi:diacylglycerol kinase family enzyme
MFVVTTQLNLGLISVVVDYFSELKQKSPNKILTALTFLLIQLLNWTIQVRIEVFVESKQLETRYYNHHVSEFRRVFF